jgi:hypothetical protein
LSSPSHTFSATVRVSNRLKVLEHHADAQRARLLRVAHLHRLAVEVHAALVGLDRAVDDLHQRALAGAVLAQHGVDLAGLHRQADVVVGRTAGYCLLMPLELELVGAVMPAGHPGGHQVAFVGQGHPGEHAFMQVLRAAASRTVATGPAPSRHSARSARQPVSKEPISCARPSACAAPRVAVCSALPGRQPLVPQHRLHLVGVGHRAQHRQAGAAAHVAGQD